LKTLFQHLGRYIHLSDQERDGIQEYFHPLGFKKKAFILNAGEICKTDYFISKGCLRMFFIGKNGTEQIIQFAIEGWWLSDYMSLATHTPSQFFIQALESCELIAISESEKEKLILEYPAMGNYFRRVLQRSLAAAQFRVKYFFEFSREELYHHFKDHFPEFMQRVPQYMLASYLGFTPEYLSELRKKG